jgi:hypothetical protein
MLRATAHDLRRGQLPCCRRSGRTSAGLAFEDLEAEFVLKLLELLADAGLGGATSAACVMLRSFLGDGHEITQLMSFIERICRGPFCWWPSGDVVKIVEGDNISALPHPPRPGTASCRDWN